MLFVGWLLGGNIIVIIPMFYIPPLGTGFISGLELQLPPGLGTLQAPLIYFVGFRRFLTIYTIFIILFQRKLVGTL